MQFISSWISIKKKHPSSRNSLQRNNKKEHLVLKTSFHLSRLIPKYSIHIYDSIRLGLYQSCRITLSFNADPDSNCQTNADPCRSGSLSDLKVTKSCIFTWNILKNKWVMGKKTNLRYKSLLERQETRFILAIFHACRSESAFPIRIRIQFS